MPNLFTNESNKSKKRGNIKNPSPALNQGKKFNKYQKKINNGLEKNAIKVSGKEGYENLSQSNTNNLTSETQNIIASNNNIQNNDVQNIDNLKQEYQNALQEYQNLVNEINGNLTGYIDRTNQNNPYLNKVVSFTTGNVCYVTNQGVVKWIPSTEIWQSLDIPQTVQLQLDIPWLSSYNTPGSVIPTTPPLISGTPVVSGQSLGNEGSNVFVSEFLPQDLNISYLGCYAASSKNDNMTFIGGSPPSLSGAQIQNGNFSQPVLKNNTYKYINSATYVPGWFFAAPLLNNSSSWGYPIPYPGGDQCASIQSQSYIYTTISLSTGVSYTITFSACSRDCCINNNNVGNPINLQLYTSSNTYISTISNFTPSPINTWQNFSYTFTVPTTQSYNLYFKGTVSTDQSTAIANVSLNSDVTDTGSYSYDDCKQAAISSGYNYFGLQNADTSTGLGYCAVSNSEPSVTQYGESQVPSKSVALWSSNTGGQSGNTAILSNTGSLQVINSSGQAVYSTPSTNANPSNYLGCYGDSSSRAMSTEYNNGEHSYDLSGCQQIAENGGYQYFGLQDSTSGTNAQCFLSNDISQTMKYGKATNCTQISDGSWSGGGWSNAVYNTTLPQSNYVLQIENGEITIYRGTSPTDIQGNIWSSNTKGQEQMENPLMAASKGKYGQNWMTSGSTLAPGDFISSANGNTALVMQPDGNLVLYTYQMETNCRTMSDGNTGGGVGANAVYSIGKTAIPQNMGQLGYIDADSNLYTYPSTNKQYTNTYPTIISGYDTPYNDISGAAFGNATVESCKAACNNNPQCAGFVTNAAGDYCWPKTSGMYPFGGSSSANPDRNIYIRGLAPSSPPHGVSQNTSNTDTITYQNYINKGSIGNQYGLANISSVQKQYLQQLQDKMNLLAKSITDLTTNYQMGTMAVENQSNKNEVGISNYLTHLNNTNTSINVSNQNSNSLENILNDSDIVVLQKNYSYLFWSILAAGTVLITMNIVKK
jgi:hypothetical protein